MPRHYLLDQLNKKLKKVCHKILPIIVSYVEAASDIANNLREDFMMKKIMIVLYTCLIFWHNMPLTTNAEVELQNIEATVIPIYSACYTNVVTASANIMLTDGKIKVSVGVINKNANTVQIKMQLQKKTTSSWNTIKTWNKAFEDCDMVTAVEYYTPTSGITYRMQYTVEVGVDYISNTTKEITV